MFTPLSSSIPALLLLATPLLASCAGSSHVEIEQDLAWTGAPSLEALEWRCVGPHVGNRGCAVAAIEGRWET